MARRILNVAMPEIRLDRARVVAIVRELDGSINELFSAGRTPAKPSY
jgi:hypothetical protein